MGGMVEAVHRSASHTLKKAEQPSMRLLAGLGVDDDAHLGMTAIIEITGLRNPCAQLDRLQSGLREAVLDHDAQGHLICKAGVMGLVLRGGDVQPTDHIRIEWPSEPYQPLEPI